MCKHIAIVDQPVSLSTTTLGHLHIDAAVTSSGYNYFDIQKKTGFIIIIVKIQKSSVLNSLSESSDEVLFESLLVRTPERVSIQNRFMGNTILQVIIIVHKTTADIINILDRKKICSDSVTPISYQ